MSIETAIRYSCFHFFFNSRSLSRCVWCFSIYLFVIYHLVYFSASRYFSFCDTTDPVMMHDFYLGSCAGGRRGKGNRKENERCFLFEFGGKRNVGVHVKRHECFRTALIFRRSHSNQIASAFRVHPFNGLSCIEHEWIAPQSLLQSRKIIFNHVKENSIPTKLLSQSLLSILSRLIARPNSRAFQWDFHVLRDINAKNSFFFISPVNRQLHRSSHDNEKMCIPTFFNARYRK